MPQLVQPIVDRPRFRNDSPEGIGRHAKADRYTNAFNPRELPDVRALAAHERDVRSVDLLDIQHVTIRAHPHVAAPGPEDLASGTFFPSLRLYGTPLGLPQVPRCATT